MAETLLLRPDRQFVEDIVASGGGDLKKCFQCATCSVACELSTGNTPFPRKEMIWAQWGLRDRLLASPDVWLCHQCNDCSTRCPRGARPGDVLAAVRKQAVMHHSAPRIIGNWVNNRWSRCFPSANHMAHCMRTSSPIGCSLPSTLRSRAWPFSGAWLAWPDSGWRCRQLTLRRAEGRCRE